MGMEPTSHTLATTRETLERRSASWLTLAQEERKRVAAVAAQTLDTETLWNLLEAHLAAYSKSGVSVSPNTLGAYRRGLGDWLGWASHQAVSLLRPGEAGLRWVRHLEAQGLSVSTVRVKVASVKALYAALRWAGVTEAHPFDNVKPTPDKTAVWDKREPYSPAEVKAMAAVAGPVDLAILYLGAHCGLRASEIATLEVDNIDLAQQVVTVTGKGRKTRRVALSTSATVAVSALLEQVTGSRLFEMGRHRVWERIRALAVKAGVTPRGVHSLRHHAGTELYRAGLALEQVARHLGHADVNTSLIYAKLADTGARDTLARW